MTLNIAHTMEETEIRNEQSEILCGDCRHELFAINLEKLRRSLRVAGMEKFLNSIHKNILKKENYFDQGVDTLNFF
jgi:uncharacterized CHY-type Zn-finger protein